MLEDIADLGYQAILGAGVGTIGDWPPEPSILVLGCSWEQAVHLGHHYSQNAIVWIGEDAVPRLVLLR